MEPDCDCLVKLIMVGNAECGKTNLLSRVCGKPFEEAYISTIGVDFGIYLVDIDGHNVKLQIWDLAGQERFRGITNSYFRGAHGILFVYDMSNRESFDSIPTWMETAREYGHDRTKRVLVASKCDISPPAVSWDEGRDLANQFGMQFLTCSAKTMSGVLEPFIEAARDSPPMKPIARASVITVVLADEAHPQGVMFRCFSLAGVELCSCLIDDISMPCYELPNKLRYSCGATHARFVTEDAREIPSTSSTEYEADLVEVTIEVHKGEMERAEEELRVAVAAKDLQPADDGGEKLTVTDADGNKIDASQIQTIDNGEIVTDSDLENIKFPLSMTFFFKRRKPPVTVADYFGAKS